LKTRPLQVLQDTRPPAARQAEQTPVGEELKAETTVSGLYIHVPFCFHKCHYCDFYSVVDPSNRDRQPAFTDALITELSHRQKQLQATPQTVFFGGGTPTYLRPDLWDRLLTHLHAEGWFDDVQEVTVEANPETITPDLLAQLKDGGINRISMGAQSFNLKHLKTLERWHDPKKVVEAAQMAREAGILNLSLDLIFAIPGQTLAQVIEDLDQALALNPAHLSVYSLIYEPNTKLTARMKAGEIQPLDDDLERDMYEAVIEHLHAAGFDHYEISNYAKRTDGKYTTGSDPLGQNLRAQHNLVYWQNKNWIGVGPGAASHLNGIRWKNQPSLDRYIQHQPSPPITQVEQLDANARRGELLMLGLRLLEGMTITAIEKLLIDDLGRAAKIEELIGINMLERTDTHIRLTRRGLFVADSVLAELI